MVLARLQRRRRGRPTLEAHASRPMPGHGVGTSIFRPNLGAPEGVTGGVRYLYESTGTRPGRVSLVLPDNLAKVSLMTLPERPATRRDLDAVIRHKLRRTVPFRLEDAVIVYQMLPSDGTEIHLLSGLMLRSVVQQYESVVVGAGARPGLVELSTLSLFNLCRAQLTRDGSGGRDAALFNCARGYFSLIIVRDGKLLFYRCKSHGPGDDEAAPNQTVMARELAGSLSYYQEKLSGQGLAATWVRSVGMPCDAAMALLDHLGFGGVRAIDVAEALQLPAGLRLDPEVGQKIAAAVGAASGRGD
jgi:Tfp pilus assembly PilM family ATPase